MAIGVYFEHSGFTPEKYGETIRQLEAAGAGAPDGRTEHVALESGGEIQVFDIWESEAQLNAFGEKLIPILTGLGVEVGPPGRHAQIHNVIKG